MGMYASFKHNLFGTKRELEAALTLIEQVAAGEKLSTLSQADAKALLGRGRFDEDIDPEPTLHKSYFRKKGEPYTLEFCSGECYSMDYPVPTGSCIMRTFPQLRSCGSVWYEDGGTDRYDSPAGADSSDNDKINITAMEGYFEEDDDGVTYRTSCPHYGCQKEIPVKFTHEEASKLSCTKKLICPHCSKPVTIEYGNY